jgi:uncharacterized protein YmfQ (DUF2313 family)
MEPDMRADAAVLRTSLARIRAEAQQIQAAELPAKTTAFITQLERLAVSLPEMTDIAKRNELVRIGELATVLSSWIDDRDPGASAAFEEAALSLGMIQSSESELLEAIVGVARSALALLRR